MSGLNAIESHRGCVLAREHHHAGKVKPTLDIRCCLGLLSCYLNRFIDSIIEVDRGLQYPQCDIRISARQYIFDLCITSHAGAPPPQTAQGRDDTPLIHKRGRWPPKSLR